MLVESTNDNSLGIHALEKVLIGGDLTGLSPKDRMLYYKTLCDSVGLNALTKPFDYITLNGKLTLYAKRDCTDQLRKINGVSITIASREVSDDCYIVIARAMDRTGRTDESIGSVAIGNLKGEARSNAMMKAETKAKRRVTLSICGMGMLDETEVSSVPTASIPIMDTPKQQIIEETISDSVIVDIISNTLSSIKSLLKENKIEDAYFRCASLSTGHRNEIWSLLDNAERSLLKRYKENINMPKS